jgi:hypothetical protein
MGSSFDASMLSPPADLSQSRHVRFPTLDASETTRIIDQIWHELLGSGTNTA